MNQKFESFLKQFEYDESQKLKLKEALLKGLEEKLKDNIVEDNEPAAEKAPVKKTTTPVKKQTNKKGGDQ